MTDRKKVLVLGSGGREHAFVYKFHNDPLVSEVFCSPGNGGTGLIATNIPLDLNNHDEVIGFVKKNNIDLTVVGPEDPLAAGIVDSFHKHNLYVFGPDAFCAQLESSKVFARDIMAEYNIPHPKYFACKSREEAIKAREVLGLPIVLKADGLAAGKGVIICNNESEFNEGLDHMFEKNTFGEASNLVSVEECLIGEELSVFAVCDGKDFKVLNTAQDHKRIFDGDLGPNTGGMGAYSPTPLSTDAMIKQTCEKIIQPTLQAMNDKGHPYTGFLYVGLMIVNNIPYVIEYNVRMGDPETQVVLPLLESSLFNLLYKASKASLVDIDFSISKKTAVTVVLASEGYPTKYEKNMEIKMNTKGDDLVFHAGTKINDDVLYATGGRVLNVVGFGDDLKDAISNAYDIASRIEFDNKYLRTDIGEKGLGYK